ncbi:MAG TPA: hypothetical protein VJB34_02600 [Bdellovibrionota bacterium]|nr:hypothetical protein [Bdellovibrionota bacterium]
MNKKGLSFFFFLLLLSQVYAYDIDFERELAGNYPLSFNVKNNENYESAWKSFGISFDDIFSKIALPCQLNPSPLDELHKKSTFQSTSGDK